MKLWSMFLFFLMLTLSVQAKAKDYPYTSEHEITTFHLGKDLTGFVKSRPCKTCKETYHKITPEIKASLDNKSVSLSRFVLSKQKPDHLVLDRKTHELVGMIWFTKR